ncbi:MAG TPA: polysaccharide deacetylase family protein [Baekduia sp.]|uniref:polysaccharide deacetylase family protein n=1 Tax=Baekduia sp. TaxID=2600305 RepID=UPI002CFA928E|nr:polysaccharide deacetylase family protein [Baekduia sp.]HMJ34652.1 polysaccharide deacetylase family protein [Baekduia sp.]
MREPIVLCYHAVSESWRSDMTVTPRRLEQHVRGLLRLGYRPATFSDAVLAPTDDQTFVVTFDDAFTSVRDLALPILEPLGVPATLFVPTAWVEPDRGRALWDCMERFVEAGCEQELDLLPWDEIRALGERGWEIGAHTIEHPRLTRLDDAQLDAELQGSRAAVERETGRACRSMAYPYGDVDGRVVSAARRAGYEAAAALPPAYPGPDKTPSTPLNWRRINVSPIDNVGRFALKVALNVAPWTRPSPAQPDAPTASPAPVTPVATPSPRAAVIIPCFNDGVLAKEAVASALAGEPVEVVVVDDCSTDPATAVALDELRGEGITVIRHEHNQGLSASRRTGLANTTAPYVFPLDSDDLLVEGAITRLADRLDAVPEAVASWGDVVEFGDRDRRSTLPLRLEGFRVAYRNDYPVCSLFRRDALEAVGAWRDVGGMVGYEDWDLWMTFAERWDVALHAGHGVLAVRRRLHGPRMLGDSVGRHRRLYAELKRTHPRLFAEIRRHRRASSLRPSKRLAYPIVFGARPPMGIRNTFWAVSGAVRARLRR